MKHLMDSTLATRTIEAIANAPDADAAMTAAVGILAREVRTYDWVGIYLLVGNELVLGPFVGAPSPHTRIPLGRGICGAAATEAKTIIVDDVNSDARYLECSLETQSEIVVPIIHRGVVLGEIDIDSHERAAFGPTDRDLLEEVASQLGVRLAAREAGSR
jgi:L-methionine (R)-S-oxide reductase